MRKPRTLKPKSLAVLVIDHNSFNRNLVSEILRNLNIINLNTARDYERAKEQLGDRNYDVVLLAWETVLEDAPDALGFLKQLRRAPEERVRRLPVILITSGLTKGTVLAGRDAGADEFLAKPLAPAAVLQRIQMVIETPRPFVDSSVYVGPCRRRKNPAEYHGERKRAGERKIDRPIKMTDAEEEAARSPIRMALKGLRMASEVVRASDPETIKAVVAHIGQVRELAMETKDHALISSLSAYEAYMTVSAPLGQVDEMVLQTSLGALEQLASLPLSYVEARDIVAHALGKAIQSRLAA